MADPIKIFPKEDKCLPLDVMMNYIHDRLSNKERNHVERHMLQCEFCNEAMEGLSLSNEDQVRDIIASVDEVNHLESQILLSASLQEPVDEFNLDETSDFSKKELLLEEKVASFEMSMPAAAAAPMRRKEKASIDEAKNYVLKETSAKKNFHWSKIAAAITGLLLLGGGIFFILQQKWTKDQPVASVKKSEAKPKDDNVGFENTDSIIAIAPAQRESLHKMQPNSDGIFNSEEPVNEIAMEPNRAEEVQLESIGDVSETQEREVNAKKLEELSAPMKQDADQLSEEDIVTDKNIHYESNSSDVKKEIALESTKARKVESKKKAAVPAATDVVMKDSVFMANGNNIQVSTFDKGLSLYNKGEYKKASVQFMNIKQSDSNYEEARWYLAKSYAATGEKAKAKEVYLELVEMKGKFKDKAEEELRK